MSLPAAIRHGPLARRHTVVVTCGWTWTFMAVSPFRSGGHGDGTTELDLAQGQRERHGGERDQHQHPEGVHVGEERRLCLYLLSDPLDRLLLRLEQRAALRHEIVRHPVNRVLVLHARREHAFDQPALMELLSMR